MLTMFGTDGFGFDRGARKSSSLPMLLILNVHGLSNNYWQQLVATTEISFALSGICGIRERINP